MNTSLRRRSQSVITNRAVQFFEALEQRVFLCATVSELVSQGIPASIIHDDGHISRSDYAALSPQLQAHIDPHWIEEDVPTQGIDWDKLLGIPYYLDGPPTLEGGPDAPGDDQLPDFFPSLSGGTSIDQTSQSGRTLLRFGTQVNNQGLGPGTLISGRPGIDSIPAGAPITSWVNPDGSQNVLQAVYRTNPNGSSNFQLSYYRAAGRFTYHAGHGHFHYDGYANYKLRENAGGQPGAYVQRPDGTGVVGAKTGFCLINISSSFTMLNGQPSTSLSTYSYSGQPSTGCSLLQGISVGRADVYSSGLEGQWLDVTGVPNGSYFLEISLDGEDAVLEADEANNSRTFAVNLNVNPPSGGITPDVYDNGTNNNTFSNATDMGVMGTYAQTGLTIHWGQDFDYFRFQASTSGTATITSTQANGNVDIYLYDANQAQLGASTNSSGGESISYNFVKGETYYAMAQSYNSTTSSNYQIAWTLKPEVQNAVGTPVAQELGGLPASFIIARNGPTTSPLTVNYVLGGSAVNGVDYQFVSNSVTLGDLQSTAEIQIVPISDGLIEGTETVTLTVQGSAAYVIGGAAAQQVSINDTPPQVSQAVQTWQTSPHKLAFTFTLDVGASFDPGDVLIMNTDTNTPVNPASVVYGAGNLATVTFAGVLPDGHYQATLSGSGITHALGTPMGADYLYNFFVMTADANHDAFVNATDFSILATNFGQSNRDASQGDFNYDGVVNADDFTILAGRFGTALAPSTDVQGSRAQTGKRGSAVITIGPSALRALFADGKGMDENARALLDLLN